MKPSPHTYLALVRQAKRMRADTVEQLNARSSIYDEAGREYRRLIQAGWTVKELTELVNKLLKGEEFVQ